jgi:hypothetical protein
MNMQYFAIMIEPYGKSGMSSHYVIEKNDMIFTKLVMYGGI